MSNIPKSRDISSVLTEKTSKSLAELTEPTKTYADRTVLEEATPRPNHQPISSSSHSLTQSKLESYLREDSFEMTSIRRNSSFYTLATVQRLLGYCSTCSDMSGKRVKTEVIKTPVFAGGAFILHLQR